MAGEGLPFDKLLEEMGLVAKWRAEGKAEGKTEGKTEGEQTGWEKALKFLKQGYTVAELERMTPPAPNSK
jgi:predicted transposase YdaD